MFSKKFVMGFASSIFDIRARTFHLDSDLECSGVNESDVSGRPTLPVFSCLVLPDWVSTTWRARCWSLAWASSAWNGSSALNLQGLPALTWGGGHGSYHVFSQDAKH